MYCTIHVGRTLEALLNILDQETKPELQCILVSFDCVSLEFLLGHCFVPLASTYVGSVVMSLLSRLSC